MTGLAAGIGARAALDSVSAFFGKVPRWAWIALIVAVALAGGFLWHQRAAHKAIADAEKRGANAAYTNMASQAVALKAKADALNAALAQAIREKNDEESRRIAADADALRVSGPGKAVCRSPGLAGGSGGYVEAGRNTDATGSEMPATDSAAVPWDWIVNRAEEHDSLRQEVLGWREWWTRFDVQWKAYQKDAEKVRKP